MLDTLDWPWRIPIALQRHQQVYFGRSSLHRDRINHSPDYGRRPATSQSLPTAKHLMAMRAMPRRRPYLSYGLVKAS